MKIIIDPRKSVHETAAEYYEKAKKIRKKRQGIEKAIEETKKEIELEKKREEKAKKEKIEKVRKEKKWFEKFHWFISSGGRLCIGGRSADQNDLIFKKYVEDSDLFFHADITGGSVVILKDGINASEEERKEAAQAAASFSRGWKMRYASLDVYSLKKEQLSKHAEGMFVGKGGIAMEGKREWFKNTPLVVRIGKGKEGLEIIPDCLKRKLEGEFTLIPGKEKKEKIVNLLSKTFRVHPDEIIELLPPGEISIRK